MPIRKYKRRSRKSKLLRRRTRRILSSAPAPARKFLKLRYCDSTSINPLGSGALGYHTFHCNSLYDPDVTGTGHQPKGYDEWTYFYDHYTVLGSKIKVTFTSMDDTPATGSYACGIFVDDNNTPPSNIISMMEEAKNKYKVITTAHSGKVSQIISQNFSAKKFFGKKDLIGSSLYRGSMGGVGVGSNPDEGAYFQVWCTALDALTDPATIRILIEIEYIACLTERKELTTS